MKKVVAALIICVLMLGTPAQAFQDLCPNSETYRAVRVLLQLGIIRVFIG